MLLLANCSSLDAAPSMSAHVIKLLMHQALIGMSGNSVMQDLRRRPKQCSPHGIRAIAEVIDAMRRVHGALHAVVCRWETRIQQRYRKSKASSAL